MMTNFKKDLVLFGADYMFINEYGKKKAKGLPLGWSKFEKTTLNPNSKVICCRTGKISGITVIDFDNKEHYEQAVKHDLFNPNEHPIVKTKKGFHIFFKYEEESENDKINKKYNLKFIDLISDGFLETRDDWLKIVFALKRENYDLEFVYNLSKKPEKWKNLTKEEFLKDWNSEKGRQSGVGFGTIMFYANKSNPTEYKNLMNLKSKEFEELKKEKIKKKKKKKRKKKKVQN
jgi:DNA-dependent RNA polymerase auxiliary subunit epsilon